MADVVMYEVTQPVMDPAGREVYAPGHQFVNREDVPEACTVRPVVVSDAAIPAVAAQNAADGVRPVVNAPKADWVAYAVSQGRDPAGADSMTKADLIASLGQNE